MSKLDEVERQRLAQAVRQMEILLHSHSASAGSAVTSMLVNFVEGAKKRIAALDTEIKAETAEKKEHEERHIAASIRHLAERETALNQRERGQYAQFLSREFFTKNDFGTLEDFYTSAWDRLSEGGKAQMSHRVWEGVRREEYEFSELPEVVKEKEAERLRDQLRYKNPPPELGAIPLKDRSDFIDAWDSGQKRKAYEMLDRESFAENVALTAKQHVAQSVTIENTLAAKLVVGAARSCAPDDTQASKCAKETEFGLNDLNLAGDATMPVVAPLAGAQLPAPSKER